MKENEEFLRRWSPVRRFLAPMIARMPSIFWPVSKAKALVAEGKVEDAKQVLEAHPENGRAQNLLEILHEKERSEEIADDIFLASARNSLPPRVKGGASVYYVEILSECNLRCPLCAFGSRKTFQRKSGKMELDYFVKILDKIKTENPHAVVSPYHHCEPLLHPQLPEMIGEIKKRGFTCAVSSNFNNISRLEDVIDANLDSLEISVSGFYQETYAKSHIGGDIEKVKENMRELRKIIDKLQSHVHVNVIYHMYKDNLDDDFDAMKSFTEHLDFTFFPCWARSINLELSLKYLRYNNYSQYVNPNKNWIDKNIKMSEEYINAINRIIYLPQDYINDYKNNTLNECPMNDRIINIKWNGLINLCSWAFDDRLVGLEYISSPANILKKMRKNHPVCKECLKNNFALYCSYFGMKEIDKRANARLDQKYLDKCGFMTKENYTSTILEHIGKCKKENVCRPAHLKECKTLNDFALFFGTDKSSEYHDLCDLYEGFLEKFRETEFNLFEYGVLYFASLNMWGAYFPTAHIFGVDPGQEQYTDNIYGKNITYIKHDAYDEDFMNTIFKKSPPSVIIDDATHYYSHQIRGFEISFPFLVSGGLYIVEDMETSFGEFRYGIWNDQKKDAANYFAQIALLVNGDLNDDSHNLLCVVTEKQKEICKSIKWISFMRNSVIIAKK